MSSTVDELFQHARLDLLKPVWWGKPVVNARQASMSSQRQRVLAGTSDSLPSCQSRLKQSVAGLNEFHQLSSMAFRNVRPRTCWQDCPSSGFQTRESCTSG